MPPSTPSRNQIEQMAFMAMMDGIIQTNVPCTCPTCKSDSKSRSGTRPQPVKRSGPDNNETVKQTSKSDTYSPCNHNHSIPDTKFHSTSRKSTVTSSQDRTNSTSNNSAPGRTDKVNALLKADTVQAVFDVLNLTTTSKDEKDLATKIQNATKDCKLYQETKEKILELCDDDNVDLDAVFGLLAKFRYERNMLTTAIIKGNSEREKALLCIQRVDHLMYMLQDVAKKKDSKGNDLMHKLGDIIVEIHDLAKTPSSLYDEFLDIKEEHFDLLNDHEEMHQKFVDVNSCHEKLHSSHDKLQTEHTKLSRELTEAKKKAGTVGTLKNDITRLEKAVEKNRSENSDLKKEVERLNAELTKVNALKHENAQLKKKVSTLSVPPPQVDETLPAGQTSMAKKKKGKKQPNDAPTAKDISSDLETEFQAKLAESEKAHEAHVTKLKKAHDTAAHDLELVRTNLKQLDVLLRKAENARDQASEKLEVEKATSRIWKDIAKGHSSERDRLQAEIDRHVTRAVKLQSTVSELEQSLESTKSELAEQAEACKQAKEDLKRPSLTPPVKSIDHQTVSLSSDTIRLLRKIRSETTQLAREVEEPKSLGHDVYSALDAVSVAVQHAVSEVARDIEEILSVKGNDSLINNHGPIPEAVLPFAYNGLPIRQAVPLSSLPDRSPQESPQIPHSTTLPPYRPMIPPPGFGDLGSHPFGHGHAPYSPAAQNSSRSMDSPSAPFSRMAEPPGLSANLGFGRAVESPLNSGPRYNPLPTMSSSSIHSHSSFNSSNVMPTPNVGVIGSRSTSTKLNTTPSPNSTPIPPAGAGAGYGNVTANQSGLGNGAVGVDWNMWARSGR